jgi:hypothetical protein
VALAAVELVDIVRSAPSARAAALPASEPESVTVRLAVDVGLVQSVADSGDVGLLQPTAGADVQLQGSQSSLWLGVGVHGTGLSPMRRKQLLILQGGPDDGGTIEYARNEISLRPSAGHRRGATTAAASLDLGLAFVDVSAESREGVTVATDSRTAFWLGLSGDLRYSLDYGFALGVGAGGAWFPVATRYLASPPPQQAGDPGVVAFDEGQVDFRARVSLFWEAPL